VKKESNSISIMGCVCPCGRGNIDDNDEPSELARISLSSSCLPRISKIDHELSIEKCEERTEDTIQKIFRDEFEKRRHPMIRGLNF
jgi:hypothetical protein